MFDVYTSAWFSAVYLLLFVSLIGCIIPRTKHHFEALRARPPRTPARLSRLGGLHRAGVAAGGSRDARPSSRRSRSPEEAVDARPCSCARRAIGSNATTCAASSVSAERGYLRETGNLVFHTALLGVLVAVGFGGGFGYSGQRVIVEGQTFVNTLAAYDSFNPGASSTTVRSALRTVAREPRRDLREAERRRARAADRLHGRRHREGQGARGAGRHGQGQLAARDRRHGRLPARQRLRADVTVTNADGDVVFTDSVPFLPQDANLTSHRRREGPRRHARAARHGRVLLPDAVAARPQARTRRATPT